MVQAGNSGDSSSGAAEGVTAAAARVRHVNETVKRLISSRHPIDHPVAFIVERVHTIELWRLSGQKLNLLQLGSSLVRGVLLRGQHGAHPLRVFDPIDGDAAASDSLHSSHSSSHREEKHRDEAQVSGTGQQSGEHPLEPKAALGEQSGHDDSLPRRRRVHHRGGTTSHSVARAILVLTAEVASTELYMGLLTALFSHGISSLALREELTSASTSASSNHAPPGAAASAATAAHSEVVKPRATSASAIPSTNNGVSAAHESHTGSPGVAHPAWRRLSSETAHALQEVHRAAREVIHRMYADIMKLNEVFAQAAPEQARDLQRKETTSKSVECGAAVQDARSGAPLHARSPEEQVPELCARLTHFASNLYSLLAFLHFFSVEVEWAEKRPAEHYSSVGEAHAKAADDKTSTNGQHNSAISSAGRGLAAGFSSAIAAVASAFADHGSQAATLGGGLPKNASSKANNNSTSSSHSATDINPLHPRSTASAKATPIANSSFTAAGAPTATAAALPTRHTRAVYTVERFHRLFDVAGHLPCCVWDVMAAASAVLSQCDVSWSLTHASADAAATFNATAAVVFSAAQLSLLRQMHRLCRRFELLRQRVYALYPVSSVRFKVKQMLDWAGFLYADDSAFHSAYGRDGDVIDLHGDGLHIMYPLRTRWAITAANKRSICLVAAAPYTAPAPLVTPADAEQSEIATSNSTGSTSGSASRFAAQAATLASTHASPTPVSSLLATLASVGTGNYPGMIRSRFSTFAKRNPNAATFRSSTNGNSSSNSSSSIALSTAATAVGSTAHAAAKLSTVPGWVGMRNSGNTCFFNSVVQLLNSAVLFRDNLMTRVQHAIFQCPPQPTQNGQGVACENDAPLVCRDAPASAAVRAPDLHALFTKYGCRLALVLLLGELQWRAQHHHEDHPVLPDYVNAQLPAPFNDHRQHDASEFFHALLDQLDEPAQPGGAVVGRWFNGKTASTMTCTRCRHTRTHVNAFWDVSIPIVSTVASASAAPGATAGRARGEGHAEADTTGAGVAASAAATVDVRRFAGATATTTTYVDPSLSGNTTALTSVPTPEPAAPAGEEVVWGTADQPADESTERVNAPPDAAPPAHAPSSLNNHRSHHYRRTHTLQHLLLHVLHPKLNKELLHGSNALDCENCRRRTRTALTTQVVAEVDTAAAAEAQAAAAEKEVDAARAIPPDASSAEKVGVEKMLALLRSFTSSLSSLASASQTPPPADDTTSQQSLTSADPPPPPLAARTMHASSESSVAEKNACAQQQQSGDTAAGGGLPWYLAIQLNRFAYQRATQSYGKVTDAVPLNEVLMVPVYPMVTTEQETPSTSQNEEEAQQQQQQQQSSQDSNTEEKGRRREEEDEGREETSAPRPSSSTTATTVTVTTTPVWVAYRLQTIIVHSGSTPNSGHYFALTRRSSSFFGDTPTEAQHSYPHSGYRDGHDVSSSSSFAAAAAVPAPAPKPSVEAAETTRRDVIQAYVTKLGAALAQVLDVDRVPASYPCGATVAASTATATPSLRQHRGHNRQEERGDEEETEKAEAMASAAVNAPQAPKQVKEQDGISKDEEEEKLSGDGDVKVSPAATVASTTPAESSTAHKEALAPTSALTSASAAAAAADADEAEIEEEEGKEALSPLIRTAFALPPAAVSVSGDVFYENWVMLNDSNVQAVLPETMRHILRGDGGGGVYSALETPYLILYEKLPVCYVHEKSNGENAQRNAEGEEGQAEIAARGDTAHARALQHAWERHWSEASRRLAGASSVFSSSSVELAPEVVALFQARLHEDEARARNSAGLGSSTLHTSSSTAVPSAAAAANMLIPYSHKLNEKPADAEAVEPAAATAANAGGVFRRSSQSHTRSKAHPLIARTSTASKTSKRLRTKAAAYAMKHRTSTSSKESPSHRRLNHAATPAHSSTNSVEEREEEEEEEGRDTGSKSDDEVSLD